MGKVIPITDRLDAEERATYYHEPVRVDTTELSRVIGDAIKEADRKMGMSPRERFVELLDAISIDHPDYTALLLWHDAISSEIDALTARLQQAEQVVEVARELDRAYAEYERGHEPEHYPGGYLNWSDAIIAKMKAGRKRLAEVIASYDALGAGKVGGG